MRAVFINAGEQTNASNTDHPVARSGHGALRSLWTLHLPLPRYAS
jgi:hypothetical protein